MQDLNLLHSSLFFASNLKVNTGSVLLCLINAKPPSNTILIPSRVIISLISEPNKFLSCSTHCLTLSNVDF